MAKKEINITNLMDDFNEDIQMEKGRRKSTGINLQEKPRTFDRKVERPVQKTIHFDRIINNKINTLKQWKNNKGEKASIEDIIYDIVADYFDKNYEKLKEEYKDYQF